MFTHANIQRYIKNRHNPTLPTINNIKANEPLLYKCLIHICVINNFRDEQSIVCECVYLVLVVSAADSRER